MATVVSAEQLLEQHLTSLAAQRNCKQDAISVRQLMLAIIAHYNAESEVEATRACRALDFVQGLEYYLTSLALERTGSCSLAAAPILVSLPPQSVGPAVEALLEGYVRGLPFAALDVTANEIEQQIHSSKTITSSFGPVLETCLPDEMYVSHLRQSAIPAESKDDPEQSCALVFGCPLVFRIHTLPNALEHRGRMDRWLRSALLPHLLEELEARAVARRRGGDAQHSADGSSSGPVRQVGSSAVNDTIVTPSREGFFAGQRAGDEEMFVAGSTSDTAPPPLA